MSIVDFPSEEDWKRIYNASVCPRLYTQLNSLLESLQFGDGVMEFTRRIEVRELVWQLHHRQVDLAKSYVLMCFYFDKGIPDEEWYKSPGDDGISIQYFPNFEKKHFIVKDWFDYYSNAFYYSLFSAWDTVGHILNVYFRLGLQPERVYFASAVSKLQHSDLDLWRKLDDVLNSPVYQKAKSLRNDITHNYLPSSTGLGITTRKSETVITTSVGIRKYVTSNEIKSNAVGILNLLCECIDTLADRDVS